MRMRMQNWKKGKWYKFKQTKRDPLWFALLLVSNYRTNGILIQRYHTFEYGLPAYTLPSIPKNLYPFGENYLDLLWYWAPFWHLKFNTTAQNSLSCSKTRSKTSHARLHDCWPNIRVSDIISNFFSSYRFEDWLCDIRITLFLMKIIVNLNINTFY